MFGRRRGPLGPTIAILVALGFFGSLAASVWSDVLWFDSLGFRTVFVTELTTKILLFTVGAVLTGALVASSLVIGYRSLPVYAPVTTQQQNLDQYREAIEPLRRLATIGIPIVLGLLAGAGAAGQWQTFLLWRNRVKFGTTDPHFKLDLSFFVFTLPWLRFVLGFLTMMLIMALIAAAFTHYVYGGLQLQARGEKDHQGRPHPPRRPAGGGLVIRAGRRRTGSTATPWRPRTPSSSPASPTSTPTRCCPPRRSSRWQP